MVKSANNALEFFRLLDNPIKDKPRVIFLKHGAFHVSNIDHWVRVALIKRAMRHMQLGERRAALPRFAAHLLRTKSSYNDPELYNQLLHHPTEQWRSIVNRFYVDRQDLHLPDDPIPQAVQKALEGELNLDGLRRCIKSLPVRSSASIENRLVKARRELNEALKRIWPQAFSRSKFRSPLLILDEAHHLKNPATRLASLFVEPEANEEGDLLAGALQGSFERMLFLTATPFQLGHHELLNVLGRFRGIAWNTLPDGSTEKLPADLDRLRRALDGAQSTAVELDHKWRSLSWADLKYCDGRMMGLDEWWSSLKASTSTRPQRVQAVKRAFDMTYEAMRDAEQQLRKWVIRHLRDRHLPNVDTVRRRRIIGQGIRPGKENESAGLAIAGESLLPFLLAARAQASVARGARVSNKGRAVFAEGLASSYEAFLDTRKSDGSAPGVDEQELEPDGAEPLAIRYLNKLTSNLPDHSAFAKHPKISALVERVVGLWAKGEKVVVFCHFRETGRALVRHLSGAIEERLWLDASRRLDMTVGEARKAVTAFGGRFDQGEAMQRELEALIKEKLAKTNLHDEHCSRVQDAVRRFIRTPLFAARYFDVSARSSPELLEAALHVPDLSGVSLGMKLDGFIRFIGDRCRPEEQRAYLEALNRVQPGLRGERPLDADDLTAGDTELLPNVRLANGGRKRETRERLMLSFNTPFFPEILVASSVLAEGVDLHLNCRYLIHYDLSWNPSTLEQRTGRIDRIGAKAETVLKPIETYLPYIAATQDEKQYRVVTDRERWFQVLMGEHYRTDEASTEEIAERVPLPESAAAELAFDLSVQKDSLT
ncbi:MAG: helicase-related protein [Gammaproteobacteria bacterium]